MADRPVTPELRAYLQPLIDAARKHLDAVAQPDRCANCGCLKPAARPASERRDG